VLLVRGVNVDSYRVLRGKSPAIPNAIAALAGPGCTSA